MGRRSHKSEKISQKSREPISSLRANSKLRKKSTSFFHFHFFHFHSHFLPTTLSGTTFHRLVGETNGKIGTVSRGKPHQLSSLIAVPPKVSHTYSFPSMSYQTSNIPLRCSLEVTVYRFFRSLKSRSTTLGPFFAVPSHQFFPLHEYGSLFSSSPAVIISLNLRDCYTPVLLHKSREPWVP